MRELDLSAAAAAAADDDDAVAAEATRSGAGLSRASLRSNRCFMTILLTCETNFPKICNKARQSACKRAQRRAAATNLLTHTPRIVKIYVKRWLDVNYCAGLREERRYKFCNKAEMWCLKIVTMLATLTAEGPVSCSARLAALSSAFLNIE
jgi:hypothetical protein